MAPLSSVMQKSLRLSFLRACHQVCGPLSYWNYCRPPCDGELVVGPDSVTQQASHGAEEGDSQLASSAKKQGPARHGGHTCNLSPWEAKGG
jgi:hypothetical protein